MTYRILTIQEALFNKLIGGSCDMDLVYTPCQLTTPFQTSEDDYILGREGITAADFLTGASSLLNPPGVTRGGTTSEEILSSGAPNGGQSGQGGPGPTARDGVTGISAPVQPGGATTTGSAGTQSSAGSAGGLQAAGPSTDSTDGSNARKRKEVAGLRPTASDVPKVGTDVGSAAINIDHRQPGAAT